MNLSLKPNPLIALLVPGISVVAFAVLAHYGWNFDALGIALHDLGLALILGSLVGGFIIGQALDACRNIIEMALDRRWQIKWDFFFEADAQKIQNMEEWFYTWYEFDANLVLAILAIFLLQSVGLAPASKLLNVTLILLASVFLADAIVMRKEIWLLLDPPAGLMPHHHAFTRIGPSQVYHGGVGVLAIREIAKDQSIFFGDTDSIRWVPRAAVGELDLGIKQLYDDFCIHKLKNGERFYGCPKNFNLMTIAWYLNHSEEPNVRCDSNYNFYASRDISIGEELTADYRTYSEWREPGAFI